MNVESGANQKRTLLELYAPTHRNPTFLTTDNHYPKGGKSLPSSPTTPSVYTPTGIYFAMCLCFFLHYSKIVQFNIFRCLNLYTCSSKLTNCGSFKSLKKRSQMTNAYGSPIARLWSAFFLTRATLKGSA